MFIWGCVGDSNSLNCLRLPLRSQFYFLCGIGAGLSQIQINPESTIPMVGASGAIAGVLGAYFIRFPRATVHVLVILIIFISLIKTII